MIQTLSKKQIEIIERQAVRRYKIRHKKEVKNTIISILGFIAIEVLFIAGVVYNFVI